MSAWRKGTIEVYYGPSGDLKLRKVKGLVMGLFGIYYLDKEWELVHLETRHSLFHGEKKQDCQRIGEYLQRFTEVFSKKAKGKVHAMVSQAKYKWIPGWLRRCLDEKGWVDPKKVYPKNPHIPPETVDVDNEQLKIGLGEE
jgi:hypothetical protein